MHTIGFYNLKGGVGKTTSAVNIAYLAASAGVPTLLWDLDPQGAATWYLGQDYGLQGKFKHILRGRRPIGFEVHRSAHRFLDVLPADAAARHSDVQLRRAGDDDTRLRELIEPFAETYGLMILDCPPSLSRLAENVFRAADALFMPLPPAPLSLRSYHQVRDFFKSRGLGPRQLNPFLTLVDRRRQQHRAVLDQPPADLKRLMETWIPQAAVVEQMGVHQAPLEVFAPRTPAAAAYRSLWAEIRQRVGIDLGHP